MWLWDFVDSILCTYYTLPILYLVFTLISYKKKLIYHTHLYFIFYLGTSNKASCLNSGTFYVT